MEFKASNYLDFVKPQATDYTNQIKQAEPSDNSRFESELAKTKERTSSDAPKTRERPRTDTKEPNEPIRKDREEPVNKTENDKATSTKVENKTLSEEELTKKVNDINKEIVNMISKETGLTVEQIEEILLKMGISAMGLMEQANMAELVRVAFNVTDAADLLTMQEVSEALTTLKGVMEQFDEQISEVNALMQDANVLTENAPKQAEATKENITPAPLANASDAFTEALDEGLQMAAPQQEQTVAANNSSNENASSNNSGNTPNKQDMTMESTVVTETVVTDMGGEYSVSTSIIEQNITRAVEGGKAFTVTQTRHVMNQVMDSIRVNINPAMTEFRITIRPESLGELSFKIASENGTLIANFQVENQRVKELLEANMDSLRLTLKEAGVNVTELNVHVNRDNQEQNMERFIMERSKSSKRINDILNGEELDADANEQAGVPSDRNMDILI